MLPIMTFNKHIDEYIAMTYSINLSDLFNGSAYTLHDIADMSH